MEGCFHERDYQKKSAAAAPASATASGSKKPPPVTSVNGNNLKAPAATPKTSNMVPVSNNVQVDYQSTLQPRSKIRAHFVCLQSTSLHSITELLKKPRILRKNSPTYDQERSAITMIPSTSTITSVFAFFRKMFIASNLYIFGGANSVEIDKSVKEKTSLSSIVEHAGNLYINYTLLDNQNSWFRNSWMQILRATMNQHTIQEKILVGIANERYPSMLQTMDFSRSEATFQLHNPHFISEDVRIMCYKGIDRKDLPACQQNQYVTQNVDIDTVCLVQAFSMSPLLIGTLSEEERKNEANIIKRYTPANIMACWLDATENKKEFVDYPDDVIEFYDSERMKYFADKRNSDYGIELEEDDEDEEHKERRKMLAKSLSRARDEKLHELKQLQQTNSGRNSLKKATSRHKQMLEVAENNFSKKKTDALPDIPDDYFEDDFDLDSNNTDHVMNAAVQKNIYPEPVPVEKKKNSVTFHVTSDE